MLPLLFNDWERTAEGVLSSLSGLVLSVLLQVCGLGWLLVRVKKLLTEHFFQGIKVLRDVGARTQREKEIQMSLCNVCEVCKSRAQTVF